MKENISSINTRKMILESFERIAKEKELHKIKVSDIVRDCNINQKTFYYHFKKKEDVILYMFKNIKNKVETFGFDNNFESAVILMHKEIQNNDFALKCFMDPYYIEILKKNQYFDKNNIVRKIIQKKIKKNQYKLSDECIELIYSSYFWIFGELLINYLRKPTCYPDDKLIPYLKIVLFPSIDDTLKRASDNEL